MTIENPYDIVNKRQLHSQADEKNFISERNGKPILCCGAKKSKGRFCKSIAGAGTNHKGYGRCKFCGGSNTGPKTAEGKAKAAQNARKHGLYAQRLTEKEQQTYEELLANKAFGLQDEISLAKTKLQSYYDYVWLIRRAQGRKGLLKHQFKKGFITEYEMGSAEDPNVIQMLETIRRLVATANSLDSMDSQTIVDQINKELREASQVAAEKSWNGVAQERVKIE